MMKLKSITVMFLLFLNNFLINLVHTTEMNKRITDYLSIINIFPEVNHKKDIFDKLKHKILKLMNYNLFCPNILQGCLITMFFVP